MVGSMQYQMCWSIIIASSVLAATGCSGERSGGTEPTDSVQSQLDADECATVTAHTSFLGKIDPGYTTPRSYNKCDKAYVVDLHALDEPYAGEGSVVDAQIKVRYGDTKIGTRADCEAHSIAAGFYRWVGSAGTTSTGFSGSWELIDVKQTMGRWIAAGSACELVVSQSGLVAMSSYRIAAAALSPSGATRKVWIRTVKPIGE